MAKGLPSRFIMKIGPKKAKYLVRCSLVRPEWTGADGRDVYAMTRYAPKEIWIFRFKESKAQLLTLAHEVGHAVAYEHALDRTLGTTEEPVMRELVENIMVSFYRLGVRWPKWEIQALGANLTIRKPRKTRDK